MAYGILRIEKIKAADGGEALGRIKHSLGYFKSADEDGGLRREADGWGKILSGDGDARRTFENYKSVIGQVKHRADAVGLLEVVVTHSADGCQDWTVQQSRDFCDKALSWVRKTFGDENIRLAVRHDDEKVVHAHFFVTPLHTHEITKGKNRVRRVVTSLDAKHWTGGKQKLVALQDSIFQDVFSVFGLSRGVSAELTGRKNQRPTLAYEQAKIDVQSQELARREREISEYETELAARAEEISESERRDSHATEIAEKTLATLNPVRDGVQKCYEKVCGLLRSVVKMADNLRTKLNEWESLSPDKLVQRARQISNISALGVHNWHEYREWQKKQRQRSFRPGKTRDDFEMER